jgi:hypothetical protein
VPEREGRRLVLSIALLAADDREIGMAKARAGNFDYHLPGLRVWIRRMLNLWLRLRLEKSVREHRFSP